MIANWLTGNMLAFDTETTAPEPELAHIVEATCVEVGVDGVVNRETWLVNPGVPIPAEATAIHHITDEIAGAGFPPSEAVPAIVARLERAWGAGLPVVIVNASYDLTLLICECTRLGIRPPNIGPVLDPFVIDRAIDKYRKGKRTLTATAAHYGVKLDGAHSSDGDALAGARLIWKMARTLWPIQKFTLEAMQLWQARAHAERQEDYRQYLIREGKPGAEKVCGLWPTRFTPTAISQGAA